MSLNIINLNTYFDKIFYINLDKDVDKNQHILSEFKKWDITNFERIPGFIFKEIPDQIYWRNFNKNSINEKYILGSLGCRRSHLKAISLSIERSYSKILILEDDVFFTEDPHKLLKKQDLKDWDMLYFGGLIESKFRNQIVGGYAYGVSSTLFNEILNMAPISGMEIDNFYAKILQHMSYNYNNSGRYNIKLVEPFNTVKVNFNFESNIRDTHTQFPSTNDKKCLIFTGVGDNSQQFLSWCSNKSEIFDRAVNYYGENTTISKTYQSYNPEFFFEGKGMIFENLIKHYNNFKNYEYILVVDSDLELDPAQLEDTFNSAIKYSLNGCTWSRTPGGYGVLHSLYETSNTDSMFKTNFMEMNFMLLKKSLLDVTIAKISPYNLKWYSGIDQIISAVAHNEGMLPFYILDKYHFYNPHPTEKLNGREIDVVTNTTFDERHSPILEIINSNSEYFSSIKKIYAKDKFALFTNII